MRADNKPGVKAIRALSKARRWAHKKPIDPVIDPTWNRMQADEAAAEAAELLQPPAELLRAGGEVAVPAGRDEALTPARTDILSTLEDPNMISVEASEQRMDAAHSAGVLQSAVDAAMSARARNSLETMLCHQMAAAHHAAMHLLARAAAPNLPPVEQVRFSNASARMMQAYQETLLALQKFRAGGHQTVVVQHVQVSGGQTVVAGTVESGTTRGRGQEPRSEGKNTGQ